MALEGFGPMPEIEWVTTHDGNGMRGGRCHAEAGVLTVGKHFPGHGNGTVDSHLDLPELRFTETELAPFAQAIAAGIPALLVSHGWYPALQEPAGETLRPATASPAIIRTLLRERRAAQQRHGRCREHDPPDT